MRSSILAPIATPEWMPSVRAIIVLALVQANRPLDIVALLHECRTHAHRYESGQCSTALRSLLDDGSIYLRAGLYHLTPDPLEELGSPEA